MMEIKADRNDGSLVLVKHGDEAVRGPLFTKKYRHLTVESKLTREDLNGRPGAYSKQYAIDAATHLTFEYVEGPS
ncbi:hypothetical protein KY290_032452 [Solanum tuberosum]|uniref:Uncharacterized protein n=1 Tax=Solanum tuberosum TaxID=4113 RepID=A0ABQ7UC74_SOLTU|nr:hypothetical protein KY289_031857 [Solanum tuberosum]KAH0744459.1 hypothetical protein KY290_032452 [Solanum tuberosum]